MSRWRCCCSHEELKTVDRVGAAFVNAVTKKPEGQRSCIEAKTIDQERLIERSSVD
jgi:hypothetical protein